MNDIKNFKEKIKQESEEIKKEIREKIIGYLLTALGLVVAFAWNDAVKSLIEYVFPLSTNTLTAKFIYATILTIILVLVSIYLAKISNKK
ncbi:MAG: DUF5654 family protein [Minisyncoccia bacterium]